MPTTSALLQGIEGLRLDNTEVGAQMQAAIQAVATERGLTLRAPPPWPTTCCGRGCDSCVWEGYYAALGWWREDALEALRRASAGQLD